jgi:hypothetical protein
LAFLETNEFKCNLDSLQDILKTDHASILGVMTKANRKIIIIYGQRNYPTYREEGLFIYPIGYSSLPDSVFKTRYSLAGNEYNIEDSLVYNARIFYGNCSDKYPFSIIWYQKERKENWKWKMSYFIITFNNNNFIRQFQDTSALNIQSIESNIKKGLCKELPPMDIYIEP